MLITNTAYWILFGCAMAMHLGSVVYLGWRQLVGPAVLPVARLAKSVDRSSMLHELSMLGLMVGLFVAAGLQLLSKDVLRFHDVDGSRQCEHMIWLGFDEPTSTDSEQRIEAGDRCRQRWSVPSMPSD